MKTFLLRDYKIAGLVLILMLCLGTNAFALNGFVDGEKIETSKYIADTIWVLVAAFLVFFMQAGFSMVEAGFTRAKNAVNILMKNLMDFRWELSPTGRLDSQLCLAMVIASWD